MYLAQHDFLARIYSIRRLDNGGSLILELEMNSILSPTELPTMSALHLHKIAFGALEAVDLFFSLGFALTWHACKVRQGIIRCQPYIRDGP